MAVTERQSAEFQIEKLRLRKLRQKFALAHQNQTTED